MVKIHQHAIGTQGHKYEAINRSCGGNSTKIHLAVDSFGLPIRFLLTGESKIAIEFINDLPSGQYVFTDQCYDSDTLRAKVSEKI